MRRGFGVAIVNVLMLEKYGERLVRSEMLKMRSEEELEHQMG